MEAALPYAESMDGPLTFLSDNILLRTSERRLKILLLFFGSVRALLGLKRLKVSAALRQSMQTDVVRRLPECRGKFEHFDGRFEAFENCIAFLGLCSGSARLQGRLKLSAALRESMQTNVMRRFPQRGRGFAHATVAGLVSRSRFLWFWLLYGRVRAPMPLFQQFKRCSLSRPTACDGPPMLVPLFRSCDRRRPP